MSLLISCSNCWHNALQYDELGLRQGYCVRHDKILNRSGETTCGQMMRKDMPLDLAREENAAHRRTFAEDGPIVLVRTGRPAGSEVSDDPRDIEQLRRDEVADEVLDYRKLGTTTETLALLGKQRKIYERPRAELAFLCLGRGFISNCVERGDGSWTSGVHLFRWTRRSLATLPEIDPSDLRFENGLPLSRKVEMAKWSLVTLRLLFIVDLALLAQQTEPGHRFGELADVLDQATADLEGIQPEKLLGWMDNKLRKRINAVLPAQEMDRLIANINLSARR